MDVAEKVDEAIAELEGEFGELVVEASGDGGAYVTVQNITIGHAWDPHLIDLTFLVPFNFPFSYIYPFYCDAQLHKTNGDSLPSAIQHVEWRGGQVTQISLRPSRWQPQHETASSLVYLVRHWLRLN
jgi:hypothetical protein